MSDVGEIADCGGAGHTGAMDDWVDIRKDPKHVARERARARELRQSNWWQQQVQRGACHYCGRTVPADQLTMDHVVPVARGGKSTKGNIVPCCRSCNQEKRHLTPAERILAELGDQGPEVQGSEVQGSEVQGSEVQRFRGPRVGGVEP